ncbi:MAG: DNA phosphorothioation system sulfurtransferase DndC [Isosphaeraceae bacterium]
MPRSQQSIFRSHGLAESIELLSDEMRARYLADSVPWVVGYSGGKDSSATLQLVWLAIRKLPAAERAKPIHVISTDTLVEQPVVARWVEMSLDRMRTAAREQEMPIQPHKLTPEVADSFWVNLIGRGYPAPSQKFRWCTERLKIKPSNKFIRGVVQKYGEAILVLGTRKAESQRRAITMEKHAKRQVRDRLVPNAGLPNSLVYTPIEDWNNDDVWLYLMQVKNPWGHDNKSLLGMYQGATEGGECPLVVDSSTPSCGSSRFGCWVCTVVDKDRSMEAMIKNDEEKIWMTPLLELRNELDQPDRDKRDFRRMNGQVQLFHDRTIPGPYKKEAREHWLRRVLEAQQSARQNGPEEFREIQLISLEELDEIRRIWLHEKHEFDDSLPRIYQEGTGRPFPKPREDGCALRAEDWAMLREICDGDEVLFDVQVALLGVEQNFRGMARRGGVTKALEKCLKAAIFETEEDAVEVLTERTERLLTLKSQDEEYPSGQLPLFPNEPTEEVRLRPGRRK